MGKQQSVRTERVALVYCRVSTKGQEQDGTSLDSQEAACVKHAQDLGYTVGRVSREVYSGADLYDRPKLAQDRLDLKAGLFGALVVYSTDRLSRNPVHLEIIAEECERAGVALHFVSETFGNTAEDVLIRIVKGYASQKEREKTRERTLRGKRTRALQGKIHGYGPELYGYRRDKERGVREMYEPETAIVRQIFEWVGVERVGTMEVARRLNAQGVPSPAVGKLTYPDADRTPRWHKNQIRKLLQHPAYKGEAYAWRTQRPATAADRKRADFDSEAGRVIRPESEWIKLPEGVTPAIVTPALWAQAQETMRERRAAMATRNESRPYLLRGMVFCATCGRRMYSGPENAGTTHEQRIYRCSSRRSVSGHCGGARILAGPVEAWAWEEVANVLRNPDLIAEELRRRQAEGPDATLTSDLETARREMTKRDKKQADLMRRYTASDDNSFPWELVEREVARLEREKTEWHKAIADIEGRLTEQRVSLEQLVSLEAYCARVAYNLDTFGFEEKRMALEALRVRVEGNGREWTLQGSIPVESVAVSGVQTTTC